MLNLSSTSHKLQVVLAAAKTTNDLPVVVSLASHKGGNRGTGVDLLAPQLSTTNGVTAVDILDAPATANDTISVQSITINNADTVATTVTVRFYSGGSTYTMNKTTLQVGETLCYEDGQGWYVSKTPVPSGKIVSLSGAGTLYDTYTTAKSILPAAAIPTMAANFWEVGKTMIIEGVAGISNIVTAGPTLTLQVMIGSVIAFTTGAMQLNATAHVLLPLWFRIMMTCRSVGSGTSAKFIGQAVLWSKALTVTAGQTDGANTNTVLLAPATAPALGTGFDSTAAAAIDLWAGFSASDAANGIQIQQYKVTIE